MWQWLPGHLSRQPNPTDASEQAHQGAQPRRPIGTFREIEIHPAPVAHDLERSPGRLRSKIWRRFARLWGCGGGCDGQEGRHPPNRIRTSKYTVLSFVPRNLFEQFRRVANFYFLILVILQILPDIGLINPVLAAAPIIIIVSITAAKDAFEDWKRHNADNDLNNSLTERLDVTRLPSKSSFSAVGRSGSFEAKKRAFYGGAHGAKGAESSPTLRTHRLLLQQGNVSTISIGRACPSHRRYNSAQTVPHVTAHHDSLRKQLAPFPAYREGSFEVPRETKRASWSSARWKHIKVGDIVKVGNNEAIPADIIVLSTSEQDALCYVETKNLDGETNLKIRRAPAETSWMRHAADCGNLSGTIKVEQNTVNLYTFNGVLVLPAASALNTAPKIATSHPGEGGRIQVPININNVLLRGCVLRNTEHVIGIVAFTGCETKLMLNLGDTPSKRTKIERQMNPQVWINFLILFLMCITTAIASFVWSKMHVSDDAPYIIDDGSAGDSIVDLALSGLKIFWYTHESTCTNHVAVYACCSFRTLYPYLCTFQ